MADIDGVEYDNNTWNRAVTRVKEEYEKFSREVEATGRGAIAPVSVYAPTETLKEEVKQMYAQMIKAK